MPDMEKVIENLERMLSNYDMLDDIVINKNNEMLMFHRAVAKAALELLKEQQGKILMMNMVYGSDCKVVVELVRCKDCMYWSAERINDFNKCKRWINVGVKNFATIGEWFCADGVKRNEID